MQLLPQDLIVLILSIITLFVLLVYRRERNFMQKTQNLEEKSFETIGFSLSKSRKLLDQAELEGVKVVADTRFHTQRMEEEYDKQITEMLRQAQSTINSSYIQFLKFLDNLKIGAQQTQVEGEKLTQERINKLFDSLESKLSDFLVETSQKTSQTLELEFKSARALIETYKQEQLKLIDENVMAMMEQTLAIVLNKKLSLEDHLDLVYEALEKAKVEKFIV